ncbi:unnamed protein product, partial [Ceratitis capitata]
MNNKRYSEVQDNKFFALSYREDHSVIVSTANNINRNISNECLQTQTILIHRITDVSFPFLSVRHCSVVKSH